MTPREKNLIIIDHIASEYGYDRHDVLGPRRFKVLVEIRRHCIKLFREQGFSLTEIGRIMCRDHTTILNSMRKMAQMERDM